MTLFLYVYVCVCGGGGGEGLRHHAGKGRLRHHFDWVLEFAVISNNCNCATWMHWTQPTTGVYS